MIYTHIIIWCNVSKQNQKHKTCSYDSLYICVNVFFDSMYSIFTYIWVIYGVNVGTIWLFNIAMGKSSINGSFSMAMLDNHRVNIPAPSVTYGFRPGWPSEGRAGLDRPRQDQQHVVVDAVAGLKGAPQTCQPHLGAMGKYIEYHVAPAGRSGISKMVE